MDTVGSKFSQAQPSPAIPQPSQRSATTFDEQAATYLPTAAPLASTVLVPLAEPVLAAWVQPARPLPLALPSATLRQLVAAGPAVAPAVPPAALAAPAPAPSAGLPAAPAHAPAASPAAALAAAFAPPDPALAAQRRASRRHRRRYVMPDPFGLERKGISKRRRADPALPSRLADLVKSGRHVARLSHRLTRQPIGWPWFRSAFDSPIKPAEREAYAKLLAEGLRPLPALVLAGLLEHTGPWLSRGKRARLIEGLALLDPHEIEQVAQFMFTHGSTARAIRSAYIVQERLELYQGGDSFATYLRFARHFGQSQNLPKAAAARAQVSATAIQVAPAPAALRPPWVAHGRTLHFTDAEGTPMGLKLRKDALDATALEREDVMDQCFVRWKPELGLLGTFPRSFGLLLFAPTQAVRAAVAAQASAHGAPQFDIGTAALMPALLYQTPPDYHVHLHEVPTLAELQEASHKALHDAGTLAGRLGLVHMSPADFYHNREKDRRWYWNVDQVHKAMFGRVGTGRLDRVDAGVRYYNAGPSGLRDLKHFAFYDDVKSEYGDNAALALTSTMGDFLLAWTLSVCKWFNDHQALDAGLDLQEVLDSGFTSYFAAFTQYDTDTSRRFLSDMVNWPLLTRQIQYFCSSDYVRDVAAGRVPKDVLGHGAVASTRIPDEGWDPAQGWMLDGQSRDLGPKNGPFPLTELVSALYTTTSFAVALRQA